MQLSEFWKIFLRTAQYGGAIVSLILNSILILLILFRSPPNLGNYKYLMLYIVIFQIIYSAFDVITEPTILSYGPAFYVLRNYQDSMFGREQSFSLIAGMWGMLGFSLAILAIHFIYRYGAACKEFKDKYLSEEKLYVLFAMPFVYGVIGSTICELFCHYDARTDLYVKAVFLDVYDTRVEDVAYSIVAFYRIDRQNELHPDPMIFFAVGCLWCLIISSVFCVLFFGVKCYLQLSRALASTGLQSRVAKSLQQQLFLALVVQTLIPFILIYIPITILYIFPVMNLNMGSVGSFLGFTLAIFPAIDPLPTMFIVKDFRNYLFCRTRGSNRTANPSSIRSLGDN